MQTKRQDHQSQSKRSNRLIGWWLAIFLVGLVSSGLARGQAVTILDSFSGANGAIPTALILGSDGNFYGTTATGGGTGGGCVYRANPAGVVTILHKFGDGTVTNDGAMPTAGLIQASDGNFYGTTARGGSKSMGTVFSITSAGTFTILHSFGDGTVANDGAVPHCSLVQGTDGNLYGTTSQGGSAGNGTIFSMSLQGSETILHSFGDTTVANDGSSPEAGLTSDGQGNFYGTTLAGGAGKAGTVYVMNAQKQVSILYSFTRPGVLSFSSGAAAAITGGPGGFSPNSRLTLGSDGNFYGTTAASGYGFGAIYNITPQGQETVLHYFGDGKMQNDGRAFLPVIENVENVLTEDANGNFYGTTTFGGAAGFGTLYELAPTGQLTILHSFGATLSDGILPLSGVVLGSDGTLYGTTGAGGTAGLSVGSGSLTGTNFVTMAIGSGTTVSSGSGITVNSGDGGVVTVGSGATLTLNGGGTLTLGSGSTLTSGSGVTVSSGIGGTLTLASGSTLTSGSGVTVSTGSGGTLALGSGTTVSSGSGGTLTLSGSATLTLNTGATLSLGSGLTLESGAGTLTFSGTSSLSNTLTLNAANLLLLDSTNPFLSGGNPGSISFNSNIITISGSGATSVTPHFGTIFKVVPDLPAITSSLRLFGAIGAEISFQVVATQSPTGYAATGLPDGLTIDPSSGLISGTPMSAGTSDVTLTVTNAAGSTTATLIITILSPPVITSVLSEFGSTGATFSYQIAASGSPYSYAATGLPAGLSVDPLAGIVYGTPTTAGTYPISISATNGAGTDTETLTLVISSAAPTLSQEYVLIHNFDDGSVSGEGDFPGSLIPGPNSTFYGFTTQGGANGSGTVFNLSARGLGTVLSALGGADGEEPQGLVLGPDGNYYGTTENGGSANQGTVFMVTPAGTVTLLHTFGDTSVTNDGANPQAGLILGADGNFYGTTQYGGSANLGTIFKITLQGAVTILHSFGSVTNDGAQPVAALVEDGGVFYGTTLRGGTPVSSSTLGNTSNVAASQEVDNGTVFKMDASGNVTVLHSFGSVSNDGLLPHAALTFDPANPGTLYGTTTDGGSEGKGTIFEITTLGAVTILHNFGDNTVANDGTYPIAPVLISVNPQTGATFYGTTPTGGTAGDGTVFSMDSSNNLTIIHNFGDGSVTNDGQTPMSGLCLDASGNLFGTTIGGGVGSGTMYAIVANLNPPSPNVSSGDWTFAGNLPVGMTFDPTSGAIMGTPSSGDPVGNYSVSITSPGNVTTTQVLTLTQTFAQWAQANGKASLALTASATDGVANALKYLFDISPASPMTAADHAAMPTAGYDTTTVPSKAYVTLTYRENAAITGMSVTLETSNDMQSWSTVPPAQMLSRQVGTDPTTNDPIMETGVAADGSPTQFVRLQVTAQ